MLPLLHPRYDCVSEAIYLILYLSQCHFYLLVIHPRSLREHPASDSVVAQLADDYSKMSEICLMTP